MRLDVITINIAERVEAVQLHRRLTVITGFDGISTARLADQLVTQIGESLRPGGTALPRMVLVPLLRFGSIDLSAGVERRDEAKAGRAGLPSTPWHNLEERARQLSVLLPRGTGLVLDEPFRSLTEFDLMAALFALRDVTARHQLLYLTEDPRVLGWTAHLRLAGEASIVHLGGSGQGRHCPSGSPCPEPARAETDDHDQASAHQVVS